ncbi:hypothetical protein AB4254_09005 [Vibrio breoganii]
MYYEKFGDIATNIVLSYYSNAALGATVSANKHVRAFVKERIAQRKYNKLVSEHLMKVIERMGSFPPAYAIVNEFERLADASNEVRTHLKKFESLSMQQRLGNFSRECQSKGYANNVNMSGACKDSKSSYVGVRGEDYVFNANGELESILVVYVRTSDFFEVATLGYNNGLLFSRCSTSLGDEFELHLYPSNDVPSAAAPIGDEEEFRVRYANFYPKEGKSRLSLARVG